MHLTDILYRDIRVFIDAFASCIAGGTLVCFLEIRLWRIRRLLLRARYWPWWHSPSSPRRRMPHLFCLPEQTMGPVLSRRHPTLQSRLPISTLQLPPLASRTPSRSRALRWDCFLPLL